MMRFRGAARLRAYVETPAHVSLVVRMALWGGTVHLLKYVVPLPTLVRMMRLAPSFEHTADVARECERIVTLARWACRATQWSPQGRCLEQGLVAYRYLSRLHVDPYLVVGVRPEDEARGARGHAWVEAGGRVIGEDRDAVAPFTRILTFDPGGELLREGAVVR